MKSRLDRWRGDIATLIVAVVVLLSPDAMTAAMADVQPANDALLSGTEVRLAWDSEIEAAVYQVQLTRDDGTADPFLDAFLNEETTTEQLVVKEGLEFGNPYLWRVRAIVDGIPEEWAFTSGFGIRSIPFGFPLQVETFSDGQSLQPGLTIFNHCESIVGFDLEGELVLLLDTPTRVSDCRVIDGGNFMYVGGGRAWILDLEGDVVWASPDSDDLKVHHSASMMPSGNVLLVVREYRDIDQDGVVRNWQGDRIVEMDPTTNEIVWEWSTFENFTTQDYDVYQTNYWNDWTHINDAHYVESDNSIYLSVRHLSRITRIDYDTRQIIYNMGMDMQSGDVDFGDDLFSYQHSPQLLPNGNMILFDNGNRRGGEPVVGQNGTTYALEMAFTGSPPTNAEIVWSWEVPTYCPSTGDANRLENGNTLVTATQLSGIYEVSEDGQIAWQLSILANEACPGLRPGYRATRVSGLFLEEAEVPCPGDLDGDGQVAVDDILALLSQWGGQGEADLDGNGEVEVNDVLIMLQVWGPCSS